MPKKDDEDDDSFFESEDAEYINEINKAQEEEEKKGLSSVHDG